MYGIEDAVFARPYRVKLEACTLCQLNCATCYMRKYNYCGLGAGYLKFRDFKKFVKMNPFVKEIELSNNGEIFLNPDLYKIIKYGYKNGIHFYADGGVNFNTVSRKVLKALVKYKFMGMTLGIDGGTPESYAKYRQKGDFNKVIENIRTVNRYKKWYGHDLPRMNWQYVILPTSDSLYDIRKAKDLAKELNCTIVFKKDWDKYVPKDLQKVEEETGLKYEDEHLMTQECYKSNRWLPCLDIWYQPQINYNGKLLGCCATTTNDFGVNVFDVGLEEALRAIKVVATKKMLMGGGRDERSPCITCWFKDNVLKKGKYITEKELYSSLW